MFPYSSYLSLLHLWVWIQIGAQFLLKSHYNQWGEEQIFKFPRAQSHRRFLSIMNIYTHPRLNPTIAIDLYWDDNSQSTPQELG